MHLVDDTVKHCYQLTTHILMAPLFRSAHGTKLLNAA